MQPVSSQPLLSEEDYGAIEAAVMETARGRWFLAEYARRNRNADTAAVLTAIRRLERLVESAASTDARDEVAKGMASIAQAIAATELPATSGAGEATARRVSSFASSVMRTERALKAAGEPVAAAPDLSALAMQEAPAVEAQPMEGPADEPVAEAQDDRSGEAPAEAAPAEIPAVGEAPAAMEPRAAENGPEEVVLAAPQDEVVLAAPQEPVQALAESLPEIAADVGAEPVAEAPRELMAEVQTERAADTEDAPASDDRPAAAVGRAGSMSAAAGASEPFPILELDEEAAEELLSRDPQGQELKLPVNHLAAARRSRLDMATLLAVPREAPPAESPRTGMVTFVDEEPVENGESVFSAPLRLEPEEPPAKDIDTQAIVVSSSWTSRLPTGPRMTVAEIEAMTFKKRAALFS